MSGFFKLERGWRDHPVLRGEYSRGDAWAWMIENACWKPMKSRVKGVVIELERGELSFSQRFIARKWGWSKSRVDRFLAELRAESMIETRSKNGATAGHPAGQGQSIISICNYAKYQDKPEAERGNDDAENGAKSGQQRGKEEEEKEGKKEETPHYAFFGRTIRLNANDLDRWRKRYHQVPDLDAELGALDDWLHGQDDKTRTNWFHVVSGALNKKHQAASRADSEGTEEHFTGAC